jgi:hypothetical protein
MPDAGETGDTPVLVRVTIEDQSNASDPSQFPANFSASVGSLSQSGSFMASIGDTITVHTHADSTVTHSGDHDTPFSDAMGDVQIQVEPAATGDIAATSLAWDTVNGGVNAVYTVTSALPAPAGIDVYWADAGGADLRDVIHNLPSATNVGTPPPLYLNANALGTPPDGATQLILKADPSFGHFTDPTPGDNVFPLAYNPTVTVSDADGLNAAEGNGMIGRFFAGVGPVNDKFTVTLSNELAALRPASSAIRVQVGGNPLNVMATADPTKFVTETYDVGLLRQQTPLTVDVMEGPTPVSTQATLDVLPLPTWFNALSPVTQEAFRSGAYNLGGKLVNLHVGDLFSILPTGIWFAGGKTLGSLDGDLTVNVIAPLDPTAMPNVSWRLDATVTWFGDTIYDKHLTGPSSGPFTVTANLDPRTLNYTSATFRYMETSSLTGPQTISLFSGQTFHTDYYKADSNVQFTPSLTTDINLTLDPQGDLAAGSYADVNLSGALSGSLVNVDFNFDDAILPTLERAASLFHASPPGILVDAIDYLAHFFGLVPSFSINLMTSGSLTLHGHADLLSDDVTFAGNFNMNVSGSVLMTWMGDTEPILTLPMIFNQQFKVNKMW